MNAAARGGESLLKQVPSIYRKESSACGGAARAMRGNHSGFLSLFWWQVGRASPSRLTRVHECRRSRWGVTPQTSPIHIPEGEQRLRRSRTRDERKPFGFPLILFVV